MEEKGRLYVSSRDPRLLLIVAGTKTLLDVNAGAVVGLRLALMTNVKRELTADETLTPMALH
jgi:hypothetical protein